MASVHLGNMERFRALKCMSGGKGMSGEQAKARSRERSKEAKTKKKVEKTIFEIKQSRIDAEDNTK